MDFRIGKNGKKLKLYCWIDSIKHTVDSFDLNEKLKAKKSKEYHQNLSKEDLYKKLKIQDKEKRASDKVEFKYAFKKYYASVENDKSILASTGAGYISLLKIHVEPYIHKTYLAVVYGEVSKEIKVLERSLGYINEMYKLNAYNAVYSLKKDFDVEDNDFFILDGGLHILSKSIYDYLKTKNINVELNTSLQDIKDDYIITDNGTHIKYSKLYLAVCKKAYMTVPYFKPYNKIFDTVSVGNLLRIYAKYDLNKNKWLANMKKTITDNKLQFIIPISEDLIQISYSDDYIANFWNELSVKETKHHITRLVKEMFPTENITEPLWIKKHYWCCGSHFWKPNVNSKDIQKKINDININIKVVGEIYSSRQAWIEGALETVEKVV